MYAYAQTCTHTQTHTHTHTHTHVYTRTHTHTHTRIHTHAHTHTHTHTVACYSRDVQVGLYTGIGQASIWQQITTNDSLVILAIYLTKFCNTYSIETNYMCFCCLMFYLTTTYHFTAPHHPYITVELAWPIKLSIQLCSYISS